jgi:hypothetical protein
VDLGDRLPISTRWYLIDAGGVGGKIVDVDALKRLAVQLLALAEQCNDLLPLQRDLRKLANELVDLIEASEQPEEARRSH